MSTQSFSKLDAPRIYHQQVFLKKNYRLLLMSKRQRIQQLRDLETSESILSSQESSHAGSAKSWAMYNSMPMVQLKVRMSPLLST